MNTEQMINELDNLLDKLSVEVELGNTKAISEYHKILKSKAELLDLKPLASERMRKQVDVEVLTIFNIFINEITKDNVLSDFSKKRFLEIFENLGTRRTPV